MDAEIAAALTSLLVSMPNLIVAIWTIRIQSVRIDKLLIEQERMLDRLLKLAPPTDTPPT
jgi:hypothetical protein